LAGDQAAASAQNTEPRCRELLGDALASSIEERQCILAANDSRDSRAAGALKRTIMTDQLRSHGSV
jgi:hypothetical protein